MTLNADAKIWSKGVQETTLLFGVALFSGQVFFTQNNEET